MGMKGKKALCSRGCLGIITHDEPQTVRYANENDNGISHTAFVGIHLTDSQWAKAGDPWSSRTPTLVKTDYQTFEEAIALVQDAREFQMREWPNTQKLNAGGRPYEEWLALITNYMNKLYAVYSETPGNDKVTNLPNIEGRKRVRKYTAIVANLAVWAVQSAMGSAYAD